MNIIIYIGRYILLPLTLIFLLDNIYSLPDLTSIVITMPLCSVKKTISVTKENSALKKYSFLTDYFFQLFY